MPEQTLTHPADILDAAADFLGKHKWGQGAYYVPTTRAYCMVGALRAVVDRDDGYYNAYVVVSDHVGTTLTDWNDDPKRTKAEVVTALREAAKAARS